MVTAAEDFIKVLATVSTSQGTPYDATKGVAHSTEEKKTKKEKTKKTKKEKTKKTKKTKKKEKNNQKNSGKRKKPQNQGKNKGKGRGRKVKSHKDTGVEDVLVASSSKAGVGDDFLIELKAGRSGHGDKNTFVEGGFDLAGHRGASNEVMKDEPALEKDAAEVTSPSSPKERVTRPSELATVSTGSARLAASANTTAATLHKTKALRSRKGERRRRKKTPQIDHKVRKEESGTEMDSIGAPTIITDIPQTKRPELEVSHRPEMKPTSGATIGTRGFYQYECFIGYHYSSYQAVPTRAAYVWKRTSACEDRHLVACHCRNTKTDRKKRGQNKEEDIALRSLW
ncbi:unnamed protein product [Boreogadus saida]